MQEKSLKAYLETITNIAVLLVSILVVGVFAWSYLKSVPKTQFQSGLQIGQPFAPLARNELNASPQTLLVALNSKCLYCNESIPFYKQLIETQSRNRSTRVVTLFPEAEDVVKPYLLQHQLNVTAIPSVDFKAANIIATPALILVDSNGTILDFWIGKLPQETEQQVIKAISKSE